jgi:tetratricopeptide (TPR) repeat protein
VTTRRAAIALAALCCCLGATGAALAKAKKHHHHRSHQTRGHRGAAGATAAGRDHLKRANALAGDDDCEAAVAEYTKAYEILDDPAVLYYRGECYRRLGDAEKASDDYRAYLDKAPKTPIRAAVEAKIAALEVSEPGARAKPVEAAPSAPPPAPPPSEPEARAPPPAPPAPPPPAAPPAPPAPAVEVKREPVVAVQAAAATDDSGPARGTRPWVWVALAVLVAGAGVGGYFMLRPREQTPPESALGNYRF